MKNYMFFIKCYIKIDTCHLDPSTKSHQYTSFENNTYEYRLYLVQWGSSFFLNYSYRLGIMPQSSTTTENR